MPLLRALCRLVRLPVSAMVTLSAGFGYMLVRPMPDAGLGLVCLSTFLLAGACSIVNQIQERDIDARLSRTANRPLPAGEVSVSVAFGLAGACALGALWGFLRLAVPVLPWLAGAIILLYNGLYTPLKRRSGFALLVGAIPGAMPPVMGWLAAGGGKADMGILIVYAVYYLWQVPHFWLRTERDRHEYERAGLPLPILSLGETRYRSVLRLWFHAYLSCILMLPLYAHMQTTSMRITVTLGVMALFFVSGRTLRVTDRRGSAFHLVNVSILAVMALLLADRLLPVAG